VPYSYGLGYAYNPYLLYGFDGDDDFDDYEDVLDAYEDFYEEVYDD
jgi:hypothetical protein